MTASVARVRELLAYDPATGALTWRVNRGKAKAGQLAGAVTDVGGHRYRAIGIDGRNYYAQVLARAHHEGRWPLGKVVFHDGNSLNTAAGNLTEVDDVTHQRRNRRLQINNTSGWPGVSWHTGKRRFVSKIRIRGERFTLGTFREAEPAFLVYSMALELMT